MFTAENTKPPTVEDLKPRTERTALSEQLPGLSSGTHDHHSAALRRLRAPLWDTQPPLHSLGQPSKQPPDLKFLGMSQERLGAFTSKGLGLMAQGRPSRVTIPCPVAKCATLRPPPPPQPRSFPLGQALQSYQLPPSRKMSWRGPLIPNSSQPPRPPRAHTRKTPLNSSDITMPRRKR